MTFIISFVKNFILSFDKIHKPFILENFLSFLINGVLINSPNIKK